VRVAELGIKPFDMSKLIKTNGLIRQKKKAFVVSKIE